jgi:plastocyanin
MVNVSNRRGRSNFWTVLLGLTLIVLAFAFTACGDSGNASTGNTTTGSTATQTDDMKGGDMAASKVNVKESKADGKDDVYTCDPLTVTIKKGESIDFTNQTDEVQDFDMGDAMKAGVDFKLALNETKTVKFDTAGTFALTSEKGATITVTVQ